MLNASASDYEFSTAAAGSSVGSAQARLAERSCNTARCYWTSTGTPGLRCSPIELLQGESAREKLPARMTSLSEHLGRSVSFEEVALALRAGFEDAFGSKPGAWRIERRRAGSGGTVGCREVPERVVDGTKIVTYREG